MPNHMLLMSFTPESDLLNTLGRFLDFTLSLVNKKNISFAFVGTATEDDWLSRLFFSGFMHWNYWGRVQTSVLRLVDEKHSVEELESFVTQKDILFVGGGNTANMLDIWQSTGFTGVLNKLKAQDRLPILAGVSAGAMYPFSEGLSDSIPDEYSVLNGLNWFPQSYCPHSNSTKQRYCEFDQQYHARIEAFIIAINLGKMPPGYAQPDRCMFHFYADQFIQAYSTLENANWFFVKKDGIELHPTIFLHKGNVAQLAQKVQRELSLPAQEQIEEKREQCFMM